MSLAALARPGVASRERAFWLCTAGLTTALLALAYPGWVTNDTLGWLLQARRHDFVDVQPPGSPLFFSLVDPVWPGPFSLVTLNLMLLTVGLMLLWRSLGWRPVAALLAAVAVLAYPAVLTILPIAWRDITGLALSVATIAAASVLWQVEQDGGSSRWRWGLWLVIALLSFAGAMFRINHAAGVYPIVALPLAALIRRHTGWRWAVAGLAAMVMALALLSATSIAAFRVSATMTRPVYSMQAWMTYRLAQMSIRTGRNLYPASLYPQLQLESIEELFGSTPDPYRNIFWKAYSIGSVKALPVLTNADDYAELSRSFWQTVRNHPVDFLAVTVEESLIFFNPRYRPKGSSSLRSQPTGTFTVTTPDGHVLSLDINWPTEAPRLSRLILTGADQLNRIGFVRNPLPITLLALGLAGIAVWLRLPHWPLVAAVATGALAHHCGIVGIAAIYDFRFGHQAIAMSMIAIVMVGAGVLERQRATVNPS